MTDINHKALHEALPDILARCEAAATSSWTWHETLDFACQTRDLLAHYEDLVKKIREIYLARIGTDIIHPSTFKKYFEDILTEILGDGAKYK